MYILYILYMCICIYSRLGGKKRQLPPIGKSVSVSFRVRVVRACVRACVRAKLCGCVRQLSPNAGGSDGEISSSGLVLADQLLATLPWVLR